MLSAVFEAGIFLCGLELLCSGNCSGYSLKPASMGTVKGLPTSWKSHTLKPVEAEMQTSPVFQAGLQNLYASVRIRSAPLS